MKEIEGVLKALVGKNQTPSIQYIIFDRDDIIYRFAYGYVDIKNRREAEERTTYHAFSITKTFTALAILKLAGENKLDIDDPVKQYLPDMPYPGDITARHLMTHTAGIPGPIPISWIHTEEEHSSFDRDMFFRQVMKKNNKVRSKPGEKFFYSNLGYVLLGQLVEQVSGERYENYIMLNILEPLGLRPADLGFTLVNPQYNAKGYIKRYSFTNSILGLFIDRSKFMDKPEGAWSPFRSNYVNGPSYGGLIGTTGAFVTYVREFIKSGSPVIPETTKKLLFTKNLTLAGNPTGMCMSWFTGNLNGVQYFTHAGGGGGFYCEIRIYPSKELGSVVMFNKTGMNDKRFLDLPDHFFVH
jgi:D-alanyl-D-alanine carboxypeptidase